MVVDTCALGIYSLDFKFITLGKLALNYVTCVLNNVRSL